MGLIACIGGLFHPAKKVDKYISGQGSCLLLILLVACWNQRWVSENRQSTQQSTFGYTKQGIIFTI